MVLTQPDHPAVYYPTLMKYAKVYKKILGSLSAEQKDFANTLTTQNYPQKFVEEETPEVVKRIEEKGIKVIAFTATLTGKFNNTKDKIIALRRDILQKKGWISQNLSRSQHLLSLLQSFLHMQAHILCLTGVFCRLMEKDLQRRDRFYVLF
jgi:hypothetical protein